MAVVTIARVVGCLVVLLRQVVLNPLQKVADTAQRIGRGEFTARVGLHTPDEIGHLGLVIKDMSQRLQRAQDDLALKKPGARGGVTPSAGIHAQSRAAGAG